MVQVTLLLFLTTYIGFFVWSDKRTQIACLGAFLMIVFGVVSPIVAVVELIHWNVIALFVGTLVLAELFLISKMPAFIAEYVVYKTATARSAVIVMALLSSFISIFVENVAVVLILAPVLFSLCEKLKLSPVQPIIFLAMFSNVQGTATLIGDPPSMILGGFLQMNFNDFFFYQGKMSIFFLIQFGAFAAFMYTCWYFRKWTNTIQLLTVEKPLSIVPSCLLILMIFVLMFASHIDPEFRWMAGTTALSFAFVGLVWHSLGPRWVSTKNLISKLDWDTTFFLMALFVLVGALHHTSIIDRAAFFLGESFGDHLFLAYLSIIVFSVIVSAFVDNVPYILAMIPLVEHLALEINAPLPLFVFALLIGSCLGGNITPVGACANIVAVGLLKKREFSVTFQEYVRIGLPFTLSAVSVSSIFLWWIWS